MFNNGFMKYRKMIDSAGNRILVAAMDNSSNENAVFFNLEKYNLDNDTFYSIQDFTYDDDGNVFLSPTLISMNQYDAAKNNINALKKYLDRTDYLNLKLLNGMITEEEYADTREFRDTAVKKIRELEDKHKLYEPFDIPFFDNDSYIEKDNRHNYKYNIVIQCIARQEEPYFKEWIEHHLRLGFEHIYIYDNNDNIETLPIFLKNQLEETDYSKITIIPWNTPMRLQQFVATYHFARTYGKLTRWVLMLDLDEYFFSQKPIDALLLEFSYASQVHFSWKNYGANGQLLYENKPVNERFTTTFENEDLWQGKIFVRPRLITNYHIHCCILPEGAITVNTAHKRLKRFPINKSDSYEHKTAYVKHFFTKSLEEWEQKMKRGCADGSWGRKYELFFKINPDLLEHKKEDFQLTQYHTIPDVSKINN